MAIRHDRANNGAYPRQLIAMLDNDTADRIERDAKASGASIAATLRDYLTTGIRRKDALARAKGKPATLSGPAE